MEDFKQTPSTEGAQFENPSPLTGEETETAAASSVNSLITTAAEASPTGPGEAPEIDTSENALVVPVVGSPETETSVSDSELAQQDPAADDNPVQATICAACGEDFEVLGEARPLDVRNAPLADPDLPAFPGRKVAVTSSIKLPAVAGVVATSGGAPDPRLRNPLVPLRLVLSEAEAEAANRIDPTRLTVAIPYLFEIQLHNENAGVPILFVRPIDQDQYALTGRDLVLNLPNGALKEPAMLRALEMRALDLDSSSVKSVSVEVMPNDEAGNPQTLVDVISVHGPEQFLKLAKVAKPCFRKASGKKRKEYTFEPDPTGTHARSLYLQPELKSCWRPSKLAPDAWSHWNGIHWQLLRGNHEVLVELERFFERQGWANRESATMRGVISASRRNLPSQPAVAMEGLVPFANGCLEMATGRLLPHDSERGNTWSLPYGYNPDATAESIKKFLHDRFGDQALVELFRAFARVLLARRRVKVFLELYGPGNTGKTVLAMLLMAMVGKANVVGLTLERLETRASRFETSRLMDKALIVASECQGYNGPLETLKALTGGDLIPAELKGSNGLYDYVFHGGVLVVGNGPITCTDPTGAVVNRRRSIAITKVVRPEDQRQLLEESGDGNWSGAFVEELPGFVNWVLELSEDQAVAILTQEQITAAGLQAFLETLLSDPLAAWLEQHVIHQPDHVARIGTKSSDGGMYLYPNYLSCLKETGERSHPVPLKVFKQKIVDLLRDTLGLPFPPGPVDQGAYKARDLGSVIPQLRLRSTGAAAPQDEDTLGVISTALYLRKEAEPATTIDPVMDGDTPAE